MTWSTESINTTAVKNKKDGNHAHCRKRFTIKSRRPSVRHHVTLSRSRHYSTSAALHNKKLEVKSVVCLNAVVNGGKCCELSEAAKCPSKQSSLLREGHEQIETSTTSSSVQLGNSNFGQDNEDNVANSKVHSESSVSSHYARCYTDRDLGVRKDLGPMDCYDHRHNYDDNESMSEVDRGDVEAHSFISGGKDLRGDMGPGISIIKDAHGSDNELLPSLHREDVGPEISIVKGFYGAVEGFYGAEKGHSSQSAYQAQVQHCIICAEICQEKRKDRGGEGDSVRVLKTNVLRRRTSRRNRSKFTVRRRKSKISEGTPPEQVEGKNRSSQVVEGEIQQGKGKADDEVETISLEDIKIDFESNQPEITPADLLQIDTQESSLVEIGESIITQGIEADTIAHNKPMISNDHSLVRRPKCRKIIVRMCRRPRKILVIGDMTSGKTNLISAYGRDKFTENYTPTILHCYQTDAKICGETIDLVVVEISGRDDFEPLRRRAYHKMDAAVICYSVNSIVSLDRVRKFWVPELQKHASKVPFVIVGTKRDLRDEARDRLEEKLKSNDEEVIGEELKMGSRLRAEVNFNENFVSFDRGKRMASSVGAAGFMECSSLYRNGTRDVFESITKIALKKTRRVREDRRHLDTMCTIL